jgi:hypothetical protein
MKRKIKVLLAIAATALLAGCAPITARGLENKAALETVLEKANEFGFTGGSPNKDCAAPFGCSANDLYSSTVQLASAELNDTAVCEKLFSLGNELGFQSWRRDFHDNEETYDPKNFDDGVKACVESIGVNEGAGDFSQSEGVTVYGSVKTEGAPVMVMIQVNSLNKPEWNPEVDRGYYVIFQTTDG